MTAGNMRAFFGGHKSSTTQHTFNRGHSSMIKLYSHQTTPTARNVWWKFPTHEREQQWDESNAICRASLQGKRATLPVRRRLNDDCFIYLGISHSSTWPPNRWRGQFTRSHDLSAQSTADFPSPQRRRRYHIGRLLKVTLEPICMSLT